MMVVSPKKKCSSRLLLTLLLTIINTGWLLAQPFNDDCLNASEIIIPNDNYGLGTFTSDVSVIDNATNQTGTYYLEASSHNRDVWYSFYIPTARYGKLQLFQVDPVNSATDLGFITYLKQSETCPPPQSWVEPAKLAPVPQEGSTDTECLDPGYYLVQVTLAPGAIGSVYLELTLDKPFQSLPGVAPEHDDPQNSSNIFLSAVTFDIGCQTVESDAEYDCFPIDNPEELNQSLWWRFQGGVFPEYISIEFFLTDQSSSSTLPSDIGVRLFDGSIQTADWTTLNQIGDCRMLEPVAGTTDRMYTEFRCENFTANNTISMAIFFPGGYSNDNVRLRVCKRGGFNTGAPKPVQSEMDPDHILGVLPSSSFGVTTARTDTFTCRSSLFLPENQCGTVNPPNVITLTDDQGQSFDLSYSTWFEFELASDSELRIKYNTDEESRFFRLFNKEITNDCGAIDANVNLVASFKEEAIIPCVPPGKYALQALGGIPPSEGWDCSLDPIGKKFQVYIRVKDENPINQFALNNADAFEDINGGAPLVEDVNYSLTEDVFGCDNTVIIDGGTCTNRRKIMVREFNVTTEGVLIISGLDTGSGKDFHHKLYKGSISTLAAAQNAYTDMDVIFNAVPHVEQCITSKATGSGNNYCLTPGNYSWVTFGDDEHRGIPTNPEIKFVSWMTAFDDPDNPEDLGDLTQTDTVFTAVDTFSCGNNALTIAGVAPCGNGEDIMQLYTVFYISEPRRARFSSTNGVSFNLFKGNIANGVSTLVAWTGDNGANEQWYICSSGQRTSDCDMLTPGYYTLVSYGEVPSYENPALGTSAGELGNLGTPHNFVIILSEPEEVICNLPSKTCFVNDGDFADWNHDAAPELCPIDSKVVYPMDTVFFNCVPDTPFSSHPIEACAPDDNRIAYFGFKLSDESFVKLTNIPWDLEVKIYDFDATLTPNMLLSEDPIADCASPFSGRREYCNVPPGTYTVVVFAREEHKGTRLLPFLEVEQVQSSRFDDWAGAYDFGLLPTDGTYLTGKVGDVHPVNALLPPSTDYISCQTSGSATDPMDGVCCVEYNPLISDQPFNVQYTETHPPMQSASLRNIIYTFLLEGSGECVLTVENCTDTSAAGIPHYAIYKSDSGDVPFEILQSNGGIDSTYASGLELIDFAAQLSGDCDTICNPGRARELSFDKTACEEYISRYYLVVSAPAYASLNQQISVGISYISYPFVPVRFDEFEEAGSAVNESTPPATYQLSDGYQFGQTMSFQCATTAPTDPDIDNCDPDHTVWYRFSTDEGGRLHLGYTENAISLEPTSYMKLYKSANPADVNSLTEIPQTHFPVSDPRNTTGSSWNRACIDPGDYYLFWGACGDTIDIFNVYQPVLYFDVHPGDYCYNAVPIDLVGEGTASNLLTVDCHTIGTELLDGPDGYDCLLGPEGYKSSFFILNLIGSEKKDVTFSMVENTTADFSQIRYRVLPGYCGAATPGLCSSDPNTSFTLNCLGEGSYIIQVVTADATEGNITFTVEAVNSPNQDCVPLNPLQPNAFFTYNACEGDTIYFENQSTFGADMVYEWVFPNYTSNERSPNYYYPRPTEQEFITVSLLATNMVTGASDFVELEVEISPIIEPIIGDTYLLCDGGSLEVTADTYYDFAEFNWSDETYGATISIVEPGQYFVSITNVRCPQYDSILVSEVYCDSLYLEACDSVGYITDLYYENEIFFDTIGGAPNLDTLRKVTVIVNTIDQLILDPEFINIEIGDEVELNAYTTAGQPIYSWEPFDLLEFIREDKVKIRPPFSTTVSVMIEDVNGCIRIEETEINVAEIYNDVYIPNAFSPNGDGVNDYFFPYGAEHIVEVVDFRIFDRWGATVFQNGKFQLNDREEGWDGFMNGKVVDAGVYVYFAKIKYINGKVVIFKGDVTVMR